MRNKVLPLLRDKVFPLVLGAVLLVSLFASGVGADGLAPDVSSPGYQTTVNAKLALDGRVDLARGTYNISGPVLYDQSYYHLRGAGITTTTINSTGAWAFSVLRSGGEYVEQSSIRDMRINVAGHGGGYYGKSVASFLTENLAIREIGTVGIFADSGSYAGGATMYSAWRGVSLAGTDAVGSVGFYGYGNFNGNTLDRMTTSDLATGAKFIGAAGVKLSNPTSESNVIGLDIGRGVEGLTVDTGYFEANSEYDIWIHSENAEQPVRGVVVLGGLFNGTGVTKCAVYISGYVESVTMIGLDSFGHTQGRVCVAAGVSQSAQIVELNGRSSGGEKDYDNNNTAARVKQIVGDTLLPLPAVTQPDVSASKSWKMNWASPLTVTYLHGAYPGREILIYCYNANLTIQNSAGIVLKNGQNFVCSAGASIRLLPDAYADDATWFEVGRN